MIAKHLSPRPLLHPAVFLALLLWLAPALLPAQEGAEGDESMESETPESTPEMAPQATPGQTFGEVLQVRVVNLDVYVTDRRGDPVTGLSKDAFELRVDGEPMEITNFYSEAGGEVRESVRPVTQTSETSFTPIEVAEVDPARRTHVVIFVDHTRLDATSRKRAFAALDEMLNGLSDEDLVSVVGLESSLVFYSDFLFDRGAVMEILDEVKNTGKQPDLAAVERRRIYGMLARGQSGGFLARTVDVNSQEMLASIRNYAAEEYERSIGSLREIQRVAGTMAGIPGRKVLLYVGEGIPDRPGEGLYVEWRNRFGGGSDAAPGMRRHDFDRDYTRTVGRFELTQPMEKVAKSANDAGVTLYAVDAHGNQAAEVRSALTEQGATSEAVSVVAENYRAPLEYTTQATGGRLIRASGKLEEQIGEISRDLDTFYSIGFSQPEGWEPGSTHDVEVRVKEPKTRVRHREEIRVPVPDEAEARSVVAALLYQTLQNPLEIVATPGSEAPRDDGTAALPIRLEIPVGRLALLPQEDGTHGASLSIFVSTRDADGNPGPVQRVPFQLDIPNQFVEKAKEDTAHYTLPTVLRPGDRQVAIGVRDDVNGTFSVVRVDVSRFSQSF